MQGLIQGTQEVLRGSHGEYTLIPEYVQSEKDIEWLIPKYRSQQIDLLVSVSIEPVGAALKFRDFYNPKVPFVAAIDLSREGPFPHGPGIVRLEADLRVAETLRTALVLFPDTRNLAFIGGSAPSNRVDKETWISSIHKRWPKLAIIDLSNLSLEELRRRSARLPPHTICLSAAFDEDANGTPMDKPKLAAALSPYANAPIFDNTSTSFGSGIVGGWMLDPKKMGIELGKLILRIFKGERPEAIGVVRFVPGSYRFDSRELRRWGIDERRLPAGSSIEFVEPTIWDRYRLWFLPAIGFVTALLGLVVYLFVERWRRERVHSKVKERAGFDAILAQAVLSLTNRRANQEDEPIQQMLDRLREHLNVEFAAVLVRRVADRQMILQTFYSPPQMRAVAGINEFPYMTERTREGHEFVIQRVEELPPEAATDAAYLAKLGIKSVLAAPLCLEGQINGTIIAGSKTRRVWPESLASRVREMGEAAVEAWTLKVAAGETLSQSILSSFEGYVVALDRTGKVLHANSSPLLGDAGPGLRAVPAGAAYESIWRNAVCSGERVFELLNAVLSGTRGVAETELSYEVRGIPKWLEVHVQPLQHTNGGAVVTHLDITGRKRAEMAEAHDMKLIAHWNRVSALGELATSLAHEVNQPLMAIMSNTEIVKVMLDSPGSDLNELKTVLSEVQQAGSHAAAVIQDMRGLLKKNPQGSLIPIDIAEVARETLNLVETDAVRRRVQIECDLQPGCRSQSILRTHLQQGILNLITNALDAAESSGNVDRRIRVTVQCAGNRVEFAVADNGPGFELDQTERIFEPFVTTKVDGLGVGLTITRSLVETAGGHISAEPNEPIGAIFRFWLPACR